MKVLILSSANPNTTAGVVGKDLLKSLQKDKRIKAKMLVREYDSYLDPDILALNSKFDHFILSLQKHISYRVLRLLPKRYIKTDPKYSIQVLDQSKKFYDPCRILKKINFIPDVIIVLFIEKFLNFKDLEYLYSSTGAKLYLYLMDMALFTGGCHYAWDCKGYVRGCGMCPALYSEDSFDQTYINHKYKQYWINNINCEIVVPSTELEKQVNQSSLFKNKKLNPNFYIPIDESIYAPEQKLILRKEMNLPLLKKIIFLGASHSLNPRKGFDELIEALNFLDKKLSEVEKNNIHLLVAGQLEIKILSSLAFHYTYLGFLDHHTLPKAFQAADIFASSSVEDSGPMMVNQSLMSGTPVVAFDIGVAMDLIKTGVTGYKAKKGDCEDFALGLHNLIQLTTSQSEEIRENCRSISLQNFSITATSNKWIELLLEQN